jgi:ABC-2 type transport system permease protein
MATVSTVAHFAHSRSSNIIRAYWKEVKYEFWKHLRLPRYSMATILFPVMFYVLFGLIMNRQGSIESLNVSTYLLATYGTFAVVGASLYANGAGMAAERGLGWTLVKRASPMPPLAYFAAKFAVSIVFSTTTVLLLLALGIQFGGVHIPAVNAARLIVTLAAGAIPFCAMGLVIGYFVGPNSAAATVNMIYIPMSFASGLLFPVKAMPKFMQTIALFMPPHDLAQLALRAVGGNTTGSGWSHWEGLIGFTFICLGLACIGFLCDDGKTYG